MAQTQATIPTPTPTPNNGSGSKQPKVPTAIEALGKINKILGQLSPADRKRVLAFLNESNESSEGGE
jgi:hypothetical protein